MWPNATPTLEVSMADTGYVRLTHSCTMTYVVGQDALGDVILRRDISPWRAICGRVVLLLWAMVYVVTIRVLTCCGPRPGRGGGLSHLPVNRYTRFADNVQCRCSQTNVKQDRPGAASQRQGIQCQQSTYRQSCRKPTKAGHWHYSTSSVIQEIVL